MRRRPAPGVATKLGVAFSTLVVLLALGEGLFRAIDFDFARQEQRWRQVPIFYRQPIVPTGEVFFRRPGPEEWRGQVLNSLASMANLRPNPYAHEPVIAVQYDKLGFRNPPHMSDWDIVVAGDSFTELGNLSAEDLHTTVLGRILGVRVLNLGTSYTGPLTHLSYLRDYGISTGTRDAMLIFFEGNDVDDLNTEYEHLVRWQTSRTRDYRDFKRQPSVIKAIYQETVARYRQITHPKPAVDHVHAYFRSATGNIPVTLLYAPAGKSSLSAEMLQRLEYFFREYAQFGRDRRVTVWLAYMPTKERVLYGQLEFTDRARAELRTWRPTDLPQLISALCDKHGVRFIDLTPALVVETTNNGRLVYNSLLDTHLNRLGSQTVARVIAEHWVRRSPR